MVKRRRKQKLASASVTTWFNQRCVCRRFHSHFLHFFFFFLFVSSVALLLKPAMCFSIWQEHDKQSISPELVHAASPNNPRMHSVSCYCTQSHVPLRKNCSNAPQTNYFQGLLKCVYSQPCKKRKKERKKVWSCEVKEADEGRTYFPSTLHHSGWWFTCHLDALNNERPTRWQENPCCKSGLWLSKTKKRDLNFTEVRLVFHLHSSVRVSGMNVGHYCPGTPSEIRTKSSYRISL